MATWERTIEITLTSLLSGLIVAVVAVFLNVRFAGKSLYEVLTSRRKVYLFAVFILVLLTLLMPVLFSLSRGTWLSPTVLAVYVRELLVSVVVVASFGVTWKALNGLELTLRQFKDRFANASTLVSLPTSARKGTMQPISLTAHSGGQSEMGLDIALQDLDTEAVNESAAEEAQQIHALEKFLRGNEAGLYELREFARFRDGLRPKVRSSLEVQLQHLQQANPLDFPSPHRVEQIQFLLSYAQ